MADSPRPLPPPPVPGRECALFLDVDGTLIDFAPRPDAVRLRPGLTALLDHAMAAADADRLRAHIEGCDPCTEAADAEGRRVEAERRKDPAVRARGLAAMAAAVAAMGRSTETTDSSS